MSVVAMLPVAIVPFMVTRLAFDVETPLETGCVKGKTSGE